MLLTIGTFIVIDKDSAMGGEQYKSKVIDVGEDYVMVDYPTYVNTGKTAFFINGTQFHVSFVDNQKISYSYVTEVLGRSIKGVPMLKLSYPGDNQLQKIQRREFVRVDTTVDIAIMKDGDYSQFVTEDISAGGVSINLPTNTSFVEEDRLSLMIVLPFVNTETKYIRADAKIVRIWKKTDRQIASIQFEEIGNVNRQLIMRFCFERQLQMRNK